MSQKPKVYLPIWQQLGDAPREVPLSVRLCLRLRCTTVPLWGWFVTGFFFVFPLLWLLDENEMKKFAAMPVQQVLGGMWLLCGSIGFYYFQIRTWRAGNKAIRLLQHGIVVGAKYAGKKSGRFRWANSDNEVEIRFKYRVEGKMYGVSAYAFESDISRLTSEKNKMVLYDPMEPNQSVVWDGLPRGLCFNKLSGRFWINPLRYALPLLAATIVCGEIISIIVLAIRAI